MVYYILHITYALSGHSRSQPNVKYPEHKDNVVTTNVCNVHHLSSLFKHIAEYSEDFMMFTSSQLNGTLLLFQCFYIQTYLP